MPSSKGLALATATLAAATLAAPAALAADASYACTGVADNPGIAQCIALASLDGATCTLSGTCTTNAQVIINAPITLQGPAVINRTNLGYGIGLRVSSSGAVVQNLTVNAAVGIGQTGALPIPQPDDITIRNNTFLSWRCVEQFSMNAPPFNDIDRASGFPSGIATGWVIDNNTCESTIDDIGILITGNDNVITNNRVRAQGEGIGLQNNVNSIVAAPFGSASGGADNMVLGNVIEVIADQVVTSFYPTGAYEYGYDSAPLLPEAPNHRATGNSWIRNCIHVQDDSGAWEFGAAIRLQFASEVTIEKNNITLGIDAVTGVDFGSAGLVNLGGNRSSFSRNDIAGASDYGMLSLTGSEFGNVFEGNKLGPPSGQVGAGAIAIDSGVNVANPNVYTGNKWCTGGLFLGPGAQDAGDNQAGHFCSHGLSSLSPAHDCSLGLGFAGAKSLGGAPASGGGHAELGSFAPLRTLLFPGDSGAEAIVPAVTPRSTRLDTVRRTR